MYLHTGTALLPFYGNSAIIGCSEYSVSEQQPLKKRGFRQKFAFWETCGTTGQVVKQVQ
jgi:hypothetical protein